jgi:hypothetical protein
MRDRGKTESVLTLQHLPFCFADSLVTKLQFGNQYLKSSSLPSLGNKSFQNRIPKREIGKRENPLCQKFVWCAESELLREILMYTQTSKQCGFYYLFNSLLIRFLSDINNPHL